MYEYACKLLRVVDGDTIVGDVDLGFTVHVNVVFRLAGINAPELVGAARALGTASKQHLETLLGQGPCVVHSLKALKTDKYGRWLGTFYVTASDGSVVNVNDKMVADGFAVVYMP